MTTPSELPVHMVVTQADFARAMKDLAKQPQIALDTESNGFFRYPEHVCLLQFATDSNIYLVDPLAVEDVSALGAILQDAAIEKVLHGADYDVRCLEREWGFRICNLYDTGIAAHFIGMDRLGLGVIIEELLGITIPKEKRLQRADWSVRPLSEEALAYAAGDVAHLLEVRRVLGEKVASLERLEWVTEEHIRLADVHFVPQDPETAFLSMKGSGALSPRALAVLQSLWAFRERLARRLRRPPFRVISDKPLLHLAEHPDAPLDEVPGLGPYAAERWGKSIRDAVMEGIAAPAIHRPSVPRERMSAKEVARRLAALKDLKAWRIEYAAGVSLDAALVWPMASLERLARDPASFDEEINAPEVRNWQRKHIAEVLRLKVAVLGSEPVQAPVS